jgi:hypothetical protein
MGIYVEPVEGAELDRLITALLNATGAVRQVIDREIGDGSDGLAVIGRSAERLRSSLAVVAEHHEDRELAVITEFLGDRDDADRRGGRLRRRLPGRRGRQ